MPSLWSCRPALQRGGISKASKGINLSEDIFAGYNAVIRGGRVKMKEYVQVGKGRDVGMQQIYKFEAKLSQGNAEQVLSRDVYRLASRVDFVRLLSYFFGGIGHYVNSCLTVATVLAVVYTSLFFAVFGYERIGTHPIVPLGRIQVLLHMRRQTYLRFVLCVSHAMCVACHASPAARRPRPVLAPAAERCGAPREEFAASSLAPPPPSVTVEAGGAL